MIPLPRIQIPRAAVQLRQRIREPVRRCLNGERPLNAAQSDDVGGAAVHTEATAGALVLVHRKENLIFGVGGRMIDVDGFGNGVQRQQKKTLPRANVDTAFTENAL